MATAADPFNQLLAQGLLLTAALILPTAICLGAAFPLALSLAGDHAERVAGRFGVVYAINTAGRGHRIAGRGILLHPALRPADHAAGGERVPHRGGARRGGEGRAHRRRARGRRGGCRGRGADARAEPALGPRAAGQRSPTCTRRSCPRISISRRMLKAGTMLYYREGAAATVSVKTAHRHHHAGRGRQGGRLEPRRHADAEAGGAPAAAGARRPARGGDHRAGQRRHGWLCAAAPDCARGRHRDLAGGRGGIALLRRQRTIARWTTRARNLIVGRRPLASAARRRQKYDVIISEPSNPWIAGVAALFTREFFEGARDRLAPGGLICQWANAYNISDADLRSIVATFLSVFPHGTVWLVGGDDVLMMASDATARRAAGADARALGAPRRGRGSGAGLGARTVLGAVALRRRPGRAEAVCAGRGAALRRHACGWSSRRRASCTADARARTWRR